jgi:hypothetical protein
MVCRSGADSNSFLRFIHFVSLCGATAQRVLNTSIGEVERFPFHPFPSSLAWTVKLGAEVP